MVPKRLLRSPIVLAALLLMPLAGCGDGSGGNAAFVMDSTITSSQCVVTFAISRQAAIDIGDLIVDYSEVDGSFGEARDHARCRSLALGATRADSFNRCEAPCEQGHRELYLTFAMGEGLDDLVLNTPADLFECLFKGDGATLSKLRVSSSLSGRAFAEVPDGPVDVKVACDGWPPSTTTTTVTTTTTLACDGDGCSPGETIPLQFWLEDSRVFGALQFNVDFPAAAGAFDQYDTAAARCRLAAGLNGLFATNQVPRFDDAGCSGDCQRRLSAGLIFGAGHTGPGLLLTCDYLVGERPPTVADFSITIVDATDPNGNPMDPSPVVTLQGLPEE